MSFGKGNTCSWLNTLFWPIFVRWFEVIKWYPYFRILEWLDDGFWYQECQQYQNYFAKMMISNISFCLHVSKLTEERKRNSCDQLTSKYAWQLLPTIHKNINERVCMIKHIGIRYSQREIANVRNMASKCLPSWIKTVPSRRAHHKNAHCTAQDN